MEFFVTLELWEIDSANIFKFKYQLRQKTLLF